MVSRPLWTLLSLAMVAAVELGHAARANEAGCLVVGAWDEARGEPAPVIEAVVSTIVNRARARGVSVCDAVMDPAALSGVTPAMHELFSEAARPRSGMTPQPRNDRDRAQLAVVEAAAQRAVAGTLPDRSFGATHFYSPSGMRALGLSTTPDWASSMTRTAAVGPFIFLKERGQAVPSQTMRAVPAVLRSRNADITVTPVAAVTSAEPRQGALPLPLPEPDFMPASKPEKSGKPGARPAPSDPIFALAPPPFTPLHSTVAVQAAAVPKPAKLAVMSPPPAAAASPAATPLAPAKAEEFVMPPSPFDPPETHMERPVNPPAPSVLPPRDRTVAAVNPAALPRPETPPDEQFVMPPSPFDGPDAPPAAPVKAVDISAPRLSEGHALAAASPVAPALKIASAAALAPPPPVIPAMAPHFLRLPPVVPPVGRSEPTRVAVNAVRIDNAGLSPAQRLALPSVPKPEPLAVVLDWPHNLELPRGMDRPTVVAEAEPAAQFARPYEGVGEAPRSATPETATTEAVQRVDREDPNTPAEVEADGAPPAADRQADESEGYVDPARRTAEIPPEYVPPVYNAPAYRPPAYAPPSYPPAYAGPSYAGGPYWNQPPAPYAGYAPSRQANWGGCPAGSHKIFVMTEQWQPSGPQLVRRTVCAM
jgi:hypothetical protein